MISLIYSHDLRRDEASQDNQTGTDISNKMCNKRSMQGTAQAHTIQASRPAMYSNR